jgi:NitT/TauT family transport system substrate-binding protein
MDQPAAAEKFVTQTLFKGQISPADFQDAIANSPYSFDITPAHIQTTTDVMVKYGIGKMTAPPVATDWVKTDLLDQAKKALSIK